MNITERKKAEEELRTTNTALILKTRERKELAIEISGC
jgi:hypothetical protein